MGSPSGPSPSPPILPPVPAATPTPTPTPTPPLGDEGAALGPPDSSTDALSAALDEPIFTYIDSGAQQLLSTAVPDGLSDPFSTAQGGWIVGPQELDPYTNATGANGALYPFVGQDVDPYTNATPVSANPNPLTGGKDVSPFSGSQSTAPSTAAQTATASSPGPVAIEPDVGSHALTPDQLTALAQYYQQFSLTQYDPSAAAAGGQSAGAPPVQSVPDMGAHDLTPEELAALLAKYAQYDAELAASASAAPATPAPGNAGSAAAPPGSLVTPSPAPAPPSPALAPAPPPPAAAQPAPQPPGPAPPVTPIDYSLYFPPGVIWQQYQGAIQDMLNPNNPPLARAALGVLATLATPLALAEEYIGRSLLNVPFTVQNSGIYLGEYGARAAINFSNAEIGEGITDVLNAVASFATGFAAAGQVAAPLAGALESRALSAGAPSIPAPPELGPVPPESATLPVRPEPTVPATPNIIDANVLSRAADQGNPNALAAIRSGPPTVTMSQLREFLDVTDEVQQTRRAQFLLDEGVTPLPTRYGQLNDPQIADTFWRIANQQGAGDTTGDAALVIHGLQSGYPIVTGDQRLLNTIQQTLQIPGITFIQVRW